MCLENFAKLEDIIILLARNQRATLFLLACTHQDHKKENHKTCMVQLLMNGAMNEFPGRVYDDVNCGAKVSN